MPRGIYKRKTGKSKAAKKGKMPHLQIDFDGIMAAQQVPNINIKQRTELDVLADILADFESLTEEGRQRVFLYFVSKYGHYMPDLGQIK